jgi:hypothetical protein
MTSNTRSRCLLLQRLLCLVEQPTFSMMTAWSGGFSTDDARQTIRAVATPR